MAALLAGCSDSPPEAIEVPKAAAPAPPPPAPARQIKQYDIETLLSNLRLIGADISPDGSKVLYSSNQTGVINLYEVPVGGGEPVALTQSTTDSIYAIGYFPKDGRLLYTADQGGNELNHVYVREADGTVKDLTPGDKHKAQFGGWADDDQSFFVMTNERDERYFDAYEYAVDGYARTLMLQRTRGAISPARSAATSATSRSARSTPRAIRTLCCSIVRATKRRT
ncbi:MAG: PD40 domain-containing protein [Gammaproteobacteria bacterium]|nr:PD40 domain-containing protein [Gammaproteobacteria bacterium]